MLVHVHGISIQIIRLTGKAYLNNSLISFLFIHSSTDTQKMDLINFSAFRVLGIEENCAAKHFLHQFRQISLAHMCVCVCAWNGIRYVVNVSDVGEKTFINNSLVAYAN